ncbi:MAG: hypothetical protein ACTSPI_12545, partial [Candidatus Heimdallarchaeaceae archaeon]
MVDLKVIKVFLSCPEDVREGNYLDIIERLIQDDNNYLKLFGLQLELRHWKKNIYLGKSESRVQDRINHRLVENCDIFIGILWKRFGSPPGTNLEGINYSSGTEEEFYLVKRLDKELWIFFCNSPPKSLSEIDTQQLEKVRDFKETLKKEQTWYAEFSSKKELRELLQQAIVNWLQERYSIQSMEKIEKGEPSTPLPSKEDFKQYNRGFSND